MNEIAARQWLLEGRTKKLYAVASPFSKNDIECQEVQSGKIHFLRERWSTHILESLTMFIDADVRPDKRSGVLMQVSEGIKVTLTTLRAKIL